MSTKSRHRLWPWILAILVGICVMPVVIVASHIGLTREASILRDEMKEASGASWFTRVQLRSGFLLLPTARSIVALCNVDDEARWALSAVRHASVGFYELDHTGENGPALGEALPRLDERMRSAGWERLVTVIDGKENVVIYADSDGSSRRNVRLCIGVVTGKELVIVSATIRPDELLPIIEKHIPKTGIRL